jgi:hypothetical protein
LRISLSTRFRLRRPRLRRNLHVPASNEISEQDAVPRLYFRPNRVGRMPGVISNCEGVAGIGRKWHLRLLRLSAIREDLVKDGQ